MDNNDSELTLTEARRRLADAETPRAQYVGFGASNHANALASLRHGAGLREDECDTLIATQADALRELTAINADLKRNLAQAIATINKLCKYQ
jgi:hypothetical protein